MNNPSKIIKTNTIVIITNDGKIYELHSSEMKNLNFVSQILKTQNIKHHIFEKDIIDV